MIHNGVEIFLKPLPIFMIKQLQDNFSFQFISINPNLKLLCPHCRVQKAHRLLQKWDQSQSSMTRGPWKSYNVIMGWLFYLFARNSVWVFSEVWNCLFKISKRDFLFSKLFSIVNFENNDILVFYPLFCINPV